MTSSSKRIRKLDSQSNNVSSILAEATTLLLSLLVRNRNIICLNRRLYSLFNMLLSTSGLKSPAFRWISSSRIFWTLSVKDGVLKLKYNRKIIWRFLICQQKLILLPMKSSLKL